MPSQTINLFLPEDLEDAEKTSALATSDRAALQAVADWIKAFVARPHKDLGRSGSVCPFVPGALERKTLWLAAEQIADRGVPEAVELMNEYKSRFLATQPTDGDDIVYKTIVVVFTDLHAERAKTLFDDVLDDLAVPSYQDNGIVYGPFYDGNEGTALYNPSLFPFRSPVPFLFVRHTVVSDRKFFLDDDALLAYWAQHFGESATRALAEEVRRLPWRGGRESRSVRAPARADVVTDAAAS
jgi:hypothetical protein